MLNQEAFKKLKQVDVSKDPEKTKKRVREAWSKLEKSRREAMFELAGLKKYTVERSYKNGNISVKLAAALAQIIGIDPYYLIGAADEPQEYSEALIFAFLKEFGYGRVLENLPKPKRKYTRRANTENTMDEEETEDEDDDDEEEDELVIDDPEMILTILAQEMTNVLSEEQKARFDEMPEEEVVSLVESLLLRARYNEAFSSLNYLLKFIITQ